MSLITKTYENSQDIVEEQRIYKIQKDIVF